jgi:hypothetical protein
MVTLRLPHRDEMLGSTLEALVTEAAGVSVHMHTTWHHMTKTAICITN